MREKTVTPFPQIELGYAQTWGACDYPIIDTLLAATGAARARLSICQANVSSQRKWKHATWPPPLRSRYFYDHFAAFFSLFRTRTDAVRDGVHTITLISIKTRTTPMVRLPPRTPPTRASLRRTLENKKKNTKRKKKRENGKGKLKRRESRKGERSRWEEVQQRQLPYFLVFVFHFRFFSFHFFRPTARKCHRCPAADTFETKRTRRP